MVISHAAVTVSLINRVLSWRRLGRRWLLPVQERRISWLGLSEQISRRRLTVVAQVER